MSAHAGIIPRKHILGFILFALDRRGSTITEIEKSGGRKLPGDGTQNGYRDMPVWCSRADLIQYVAEELKIHQSLWGKDRTSDEFHSAMDQEITKLRRKKIIAYWNESGRLGVFRLDSPDQRIERPTVSIAPARDQPAHQDTSEDDMKQAFLSILKKGRKANTYKFALARALLQYCNENDRTGASTYRIPYTYLAGRFLRYYWHQECKFRIKQDFQTESTPKAIQAIRNAFGEQAYGDFGDADADKKAEAERDILRTVFGNARSNTSMVVPKFQKVMRGQHAEERRIFYDYDDEKKAIYLKAEAFDFFKSNNGILAGLVLAEWAKFLERINGSLPRLVAKIEQDSFKRRPLIPFRDAYIKHTDHCFYCSGRLERRGRGIQVDHLLPWSYIFEDEAWNLVLSCQECNCKKSNSLPQQEFLDLLIDRNSTYRDRISLLERSLRLISTKRGWESEISNHYATCRDYGFNVINMP